MSEAYEMIEEGSIEWTSGCYNRPDRSVGEQCGYFDDFDIDRDATDAETLAFWDALDESEREEIRERAHSRAVDDHHNDIDF